ncbi:DUF4365 domain-containing protein [Streptococcus orisratti]|uniref:DUF4365 domain-containing protein n=1 Tax=Streptococcus orisratti TaxID=114652 RepID=UPI000380F01F|nr:DUF4365 domain-containing protein [Streptococcus orisratti]
MSNSTEREGVFHCGKIAARNKWIFREQPIDDIGIDAHMEFIEDDKPRQLLALQIKSGPSWFKEKKDDCIIFRNINERQYNYWTMNSLPCIIVLYNTDDNMCIWQELTTDTIKRTKDGTGKGFYVEVPLNQIFLDESSNKKLLSYSNLPQHIQNYNFLLSQKRFMEIIQNGGEVKLHSKEWVNKSSGRGETKLIVNDGEKVKEYSYPYWFPYTPYTEVFPKLFPWANFSSDEDFVEEEDEKLWKQYHCYYDQEIEKWLVVGDTFEEFRQKLDPMRYIDHVGEVAEFMLVLSLNELGRAFLEVEQFVSQNRPYAKARPESKDK